MRIDQWQKEARHGVGNDCCRNNPGSRAARACNKHPRPYAQLGISRPMRDRCGTIFGCVVAEELTKDSSATIGASVLDGPATAAATDVVSTICKGDVRPARGW